MTTPNTQLAYAVLDHIDAHPEQWNQATWWKQTECGTAGCFAGWAVALTGGTLRFDQWGTVHAVDPDGGQGPVSTAALAALGINSDNYDCNDADDCERCNDRCCDDPDCCGHYLFAATNTRADLQRGVEAIFGPLDGCRG